MWNHVAPECSRRSAPLAVRRSRCRGAKRSASLSMHERTWLLSTWLNNWLRLRPGDYKLLVLVRGAIGWRGRRGG